MEKLKIILSVVLISIQPYIIYMGCVENEPLAIVAGIGNLLIGVFALVSGIIELKEITMCKEKKDEAKVVLHPATYLFYAKNGRTKPGRISKIETGSFPRYHVDEGIVYIDVTPQMDCSFFIPVKETEEELLALFGREKK